MSYRAPTHLLEVLQRLEYEEALPAGDPRYVETQEARGSEETLKRLARKFGWDPSTNASFAPNEKHVLFFGHIGSGKTTELRRYMGRFDDSRRFYVVEVDVLTKLDRNNLQYTEVLMAMAESLLERLNGDGYRFDEAALRPMQQWFAPAVATFTTGFKTGASTKDEWREQIRNRFTSLVIAFNGLIRSAEAALKALGRAERVLFLIDGTDKMRGQDTEKFFVLDAEQLLAIHALAIYTAPLHLKYDGSLGGKLDTDMVLPMIKLQDRDGARWQPGWTALRELLLLRADRSLFEPGTAGDEQIDRLVQACGGHPRELLRLLKLCCEVADDKLDAPVVDRAIEQLASEYRRFLVPDDYTLLATIDADPVHGGNDQRAQDLLYRLALLEYNDGGWRRSHPVVRTLDGYQQAVASPAPKPAALPPVS